MDGYVVICLSGLSDHAATEQPGFLVKAYGPFPRRALAVAARRQLRPIEGGALLVRPLVDLDDTFRRISAD